MPKNDIFAGAQPAERNPAVGIVVHDNTLAARRPRSAAFVWGGEDASAPSLPYGRWKPGARAA
jgi:hypothetical protein